ncbi:hypothetical protein SAMN02910339_01367 [Lachnospiraceae bacterium YSD2013]|nr:hypothetical protein SAMN02910339_01367 [Lachnospiraceae bacterium YSD2013]
MNNKNLELIFSNYIKNFELINDTEHEEYYKWQVCNVFPVLMSKALEASDEDLPRALYEVKKSTFNIIDSYTQPMAGLVDFARKDASAVRELLKNLYAPDGEDLKVQMEKIADFFKRSDELLEKFFPGSFLYKQNSHSVSSLLFLNDPEHHYMYKATQSQRFADCVEFYDDWGSGDNINLEKYYGMCNELVAQIKECEPLLNTDASRFDGRLKLKGGALHPDTEKHILAFDIIYCCSVYDLFNGITFTKRNMKEKQLYLAEKAKAERLKLSYEKAKSDMDALEEALRSLVDMIPVGSSVKHPKFGIGTVKSINEGRIIIDFPNKEIMFGLATTAANNIVSVDNPSFVEKAKEYKLILQRYSNIPRLLESAARDLKPYEEFLE